MKFLSFLCTKWMENCEAMTSSPHSFAYSYRLVKKCFLKICEISKCHMFLIFQPIFIRFSLLCLKFFTLSSEIELNLLWSSSLNNQWFMNLILLRRTIQLKLRIYPYATLSATDFEPRTLSCKGILGRMRTKRRGGAKEVAPPPPPQDFQEVIFGQKNMLYLGKATWFSGKQWRKYSAGDVPPPPPRTKLDLYTPICPRSYQISHIRQSSSWIVSLIFIKKMFTQPFHRSWDCFSVQLMMGKVGLFLCFHEFWFVKNGSIVHRINSSAPVRWTVTFFLYPK